MVLEADLLLKGRVWERLFLSFFLFFLSSFLPVLGLHCCARSLSLIAASRGYLQCKGFSLWWLLLLRSTGSRRAGFSSCGSRALERRLSSCGARA